MSSDDKETAIKHAILLTGDTSEAIVNSIEAFRLFVGHYIEIQNPKASVVPIGVATLRVTLPPEEAERTVSLARLFGQLDKLNPLQSLRAMAFNLGSLVGRDPRGEQDSLENRLGDVVPLLKSADYARGNAAALRRHHEAQGQDPNLHAKVSWVVSDQIVAFPVVNDEEGYRFITRDSLTAIGVTAQELQEIALENIRRIADGMPPSDYDNGMSEFKSLGGAASALILLPEFLEREAGRAGGPLCFLSGDADHLFAVPLSNEVFLDFVLGKVARGELKLPELPPLVYQDGRLEPAAIEIVESPSARLQ